MMNRLYLGDITTDSGIMRFEPRRVEVTKSEGQHEQATLWTRSSTRGTDYSSIIGQRITFAYGIPGQQVVFQGYVSAVQPQQYVASQQYVVEQEVNCLGATMVMKGNKPRFLVDATVTDFIRQIITDNGLGFSNEFNQGDDLHWRTLAQTSESDWQMAVKLADRIGAHIVPSRGVVRLVDYNDISFREMASHWFQMRQKVAQADGTNQGDIVSFEPVNLSTADPMYRVPAMSFLQGSQTVLVQASGRQGPLPRRFATDIPARTVAEATTLQQGYYLPQWSQQGTITVVGDATIEPASVCAIASTSGQERTVLRPDFDGLWYVKQVRHVVYTNQFFSTMQLGRIDSRGSNWYQPIPFWRTDKRGLPQLIPSGDGAWLSTWRAAA